MRDDLGRGELEVLHDVAADARSGPSEARLKMPKFCEKKRGSRDAHSAVSGPIRGGGSNSGLGEISGPIRTL